MRYSRLVIGLLLIALAVWVITTEQLSGASANAVLNAQLNTQRAPIAGTVTMAPRALGSSVSLGEELASVNDPLVDVVRLNDLEMERGFAIAEIARLAAQIEAVAAQVTPLADRAMTFKTSRIAEIETRLTYARARLALLEQGVPEDGGISGLVDEGQSGAQDDPRVPGLALEYARERVGVLEVTLQAARAGVFLGDGYNDAPYAEQRRHELETLQASLVAELAQAEARVATIETRIGAERQRTAALGAAPLRSTVNGELWEVLAADGETVQRGQDVLRLLDCDTTFVTLSVTESIYNRLAIGDEAVFRLDGDGRSFAGSVIRLAGSGAQTVYRNLAVAPSNRHLERFDVALLVPALQDVPELRCAIGRTGRAFFDTRPLDWLRDLLR